MGSAMSEQVLKRLIATYGKDPDEWPPEVQPLALGGGVSADVLQRFLDPSPASGAVATPQQPPAVSADTAAPQFAGGTHVG